MTTNTVRDQRECMEVQGIRRDTSVKIAAGQSLGGKNGRQRGPWGKTWNMLPAWIPGHDGVVLIVQCLWSPKGKLGISGL